MLARGLRGTIGRRRLAGRGGPCAEVRTSPARPACVRPRASDPRVAPWSPGRRRSGRCGPARMGWARRGDRARARRGVADRQGLAGPHAEPTGHSRLAPLAPSAPASTPSRPSPRRRARDCGHCDGDRRSDRPRLVADAERLLARKGPLARRAGRLDAERPRACRPRVDCSCHHRLLPAAPSRAGIPVGARAHAALDRVQPREGARHRRGDADDGRRRASVGEPLVVLRSARARIAPHRALAGAVADRRGDCGCAVARRGRRAGRSIGRRNRAPDVRLVSLATGPVPISGRVRTYGARDQAHRALDAGRRWLSALPATCRSARPSRSRSAACGGRARSRVRDGHARVLQAPRRQALPLQPERQGVRRVPGGERRDDGLGRSGRGRRRGQRA